MEKGWTKTYLQQNEFGAIEDMSTPDKPYSSFNVYRMTGAKNPRAFYKSCYKLETAHNILKELEARPKNPVPVNFLK